MTIVLPDNYHVRSALQERRILCIDYERALREDIRALRIGIFNIMPQAEHYEYSLLFPLGRTVIQIEPVWLRLKNHHYNSSNKEHLRNFYITFEQALEGGGLDGLIVTGAPVEEIPFEEVTYWNEVRDILNYARENTVSTLGICWGALALAKHLGMEKVRFEKKLFGVFETENIDRKHRITGEMDDIFWCPQSRHSGVADETIDREARDGRIIPLAYSNETGYTIFESGDHRFLMHLGHPEYDVRRLVDEYERDMRKGREDVEAPVNFDLARPRNRWRAHSLEFFSQWVKYIHEEIAFQNKNKNKV